MTTDEAIQNMHAALDTGVFSQSVGSGTAYTLTNTFAPVSFGTSGDLSVSIPSAGTYEVASNFQIGNADIFSQGEFSITAILHDGAPIANTERTLASYITDLSGNAVTTDIGGSKSPSWIITTSGAVTLKVYVATSASKTGQTIISDSAGRTTLAYKKLR